MREGTVSMLVDADLVEVITELGARFGVGEFLRDLEPSRNWESRTSVLYKLDSRDEPAGVVLKVGKAWTAEKAREVYEDLRSLESLLGSDARLRINVPRVFGWHEAPPCVCVSYIEGEDLSQMLSRRAGYLSPEVEDALEQCGSALGVFHTSEVIDLSAPESPVDEDEIRGRLTRMARRVLVGPVLVRAVDLGGVVSRRYGDFAPYNVRLTEDGDVCVLDQPSSRSFAPIHRDVSYFLYRVGLRIGRYEPDDPAELAAAQQRLEGIFLSGYARTGPSALDSPADQALMALYRAYKSLRTATKRFDQRQYREIPKFLLLAFRWRRQARQAPSSGSSKREAGPP